MVQLLQIVTADASAFLLLFLLKLHMSKKVKNSALLDVKLISAMINLTMFQCVIDTVVFWMDGKMFPAAREWNYFGNIIYYSLNATVSYFWPLFIEYKLSNSAEKVKKLAITLAIPHSIIIIAVATTPINGFMFTITEDNLYQRTGYNFLIPTMLIIFYIVFGTAKVYIRRKREGKYMFFPVIYFVTPIFLGIIVQAFNYGISLLYIGIAIGLTGVYLSTQSESAYIDQLCGIYNRRYYNDYIRALCNSKNCKVTGVLIDMDNFKPINDNFGHDVGDEALIQFSKVLRRNINHIGFAVRYGGDEFILISNQSAAAVQAAVDNIQKELAEINTSGENRFNLAFSYGIAEMFSDSNPEEFLKVMDSRMYEMKRERKVGR